MGIVFSLILGNRIRWYVLRCIRTSDSLPVELIYKAFYVENKLTFQIYYIILIIVNRYTYCRYILFYIFVIIRTFDYFLSHSHCKSEYKNILNFILHRLCLEFFKVVLIFIVWVTNIFILCINFSSSLHLVIYNLFQN